MSKILARRSLPKLLPKKLLRKLKVPSTLLPTQAQLARKLPFYCLHLPLFYFNALISWSVAMLSDPLKRQKRKKTRLMEQLRRALPTPWFFPKETALPRKLRLFRSVAQKRRLPCPAPERLQLRKLGPGLDTLKKLPLGVHRLPIWRM